MGIKHHTPTGKPDDPADPVSTGEWEENHDVDSGTATILANHTYVDVPHGMGTTPDLNRININYQSDMGGLQVKLSNVGVTTFRININGIATEDLVFGWNIV